ncbi:MAG: hypothetical protein K0R47_2983 [Brevibacillus sp.]|jgi:hypothetical protein|nr:hypothetical protein [Brevibacillus sp.]
MASISKRGSVLTQYKLSEGHFFMLTEERKSSNLQLTDLVNQKTNSDFDAFTSEQYLFWLILTDWINQNIYTRSDSE